MMVPVLNQPLPLCLQQYTNFNQFLAYTNLNQ
jgi:hypothetical protein